MNQSIPSGDIAPRNSSSTSSTSSSSSSSESGRAGAVKRARSKSRDAAPRVTSPVSLLALVPSLLGFQPDNSMVIIGIEPPRAQVKLTLRYDLPDPPRAQFGRDLVEHALAVLGAQRLTTAVAVGYGPGSLVTPVADTIRAAAAGTELRVTELLRVEGDRYWSYLCSDPDCCPPEGTVFDAASQAAALAALAAPDGRPSVLASRAELAATVAAVGGEQAGLMQAATRGAEEHAARLIARVARSGRSRSGRRLIASAGLAAVKETVRRYRRGEQLDAGMAVAWLTVALRDVRVRDDAWARMDPRYGKDHIRLWTDITRLACPGYVAAPASLLAFVAWQSGNGALANVALDRALGDNPRYSMAQLLRQVIDSGAPPSLARLPMSPEEVAASYAGLTGEPGEDSDEPGEDPEDPEGPVDPGGGPVDPGEDPEDPAECPEIADAAEIAGIAAEEVPSSDAGPQDG